MNKIYKTVLSVSAAAIVAGVTLVPATVKASDTNKDRETYTIEQINAGALGDKIVLNSISDNGVIGNELNFVGARLTTESGVWHGNEMDVKDGDVVNVRLYVHNNSPKALEGIAKNVTASFGIPTLVAKSHTIMGYLDADNATPNHIGDGVVLNSDEDFYLEYVDGSASYYNNAGTFGLSDDIIVSGVKLGYEVMDGNIPGCYQYSGEVTIQVKVHKSVNAYLSKTVRIKDSGNEFTEYVEAGIGDEVEYQIEYQNLLNEQVDDVMIRDVLPTNMEYVAGSTYIYNAAYTDWGHVDSDDLTTSGINIGSYLPKGNAFIRFTAKVTDKNLGCGKTQLVNWASSTVNTLVVKDDASVLVAKTCENEDVPETPKTLPNTGAGAVMAGALGAGAITTAAGYFIASRKKLM